MANILDLAPDQFTAALDELGVRGSERDGLLRQYQDHHSAAAPLFSFLDRSSQATAGKGMDRANLLPIEKPQGQSVWDAIQSGTWNFAMPQAAVDTVRSTARAVVNPSNALKGVPYTPQQTAEDAIAGSAVAMTLGGMSPSPKGSVRSNAPSWFGKQAKDMTPDETNAWADADMETYHAHVKAKDDVLFEGVPFDEAIKKHWATVDPNPSDDISPFPTDGVDEDFVDLQDLDWDAEPEPLAPAPLKIMIDEPAKPSWFGKHHTDMTDDEVLDYSSDKYPDSLFAEHDAAVEAAKGGPAKPSWFGKKFAEMTDDEAADYIGGKWTDDLLNAHDIAKEKASEAKAVADSAPSADPVGDVIYKELLDKLQGNSGVPLPRTEAQRRAVEVADLLAKGRESEVTNWLYDNADLEYLRKLYDAGATGRRMPMDFKSRMERAASQGYNTGNPLYRGRGADRPHNQDQHTFTSDNPAVAAGYVRTKSNDFYGNIVKLLGRGGSEMPEVVPPPKTSWQTMARDHTVLMPDGTDLSLEEFFHRAGMRMNDTATTDFIGSAAQELGFKGVKFRNIRDAGGSEWDWAYDNDSLRGTSPSNVRIDFYNSSNLRVPSAVFDPRLQHLKNYSAANASPATGVASLAAQEDDARESLMRYLQERGDRR